MCVTFSVLATSLVFMAACMNHMRNVGQAPLTSLKHFQCKQFKLHLDMQVTQYVTSDLSLHCLKLFFKGIALLIGLVLFFYSPSCNGKYAHTYKCKKNLHILKYVTFDIF